MCATAARYPEEPHTHPYTFDGPSLDNHFWAFVAEKMVTHPELIIEQVHNRQRELKEQGDTLNSDIAKKRQQLAMIEQDKMTYTRQLGRGKITETVYDVLMAECDENEADLQDQLTHLLALRDDQKKVNSAIAYTEEMLTNIRRRLPEINQKPEELASLPEEKQREIMLERQDIIKGLVDKAIIFADGSIKIMGLIEVSDFIIANSIKRK